MKVIIDDKMYDSNDEKIILILEPCEANIIGNLKEASDIVFSPVGGITYHLPINKEDINEK